MNSHTVPNSWIGGCECTIDRFMYLVVRTAGIAFLLLIDFLHCSSGKLIKLAREYFAKCVLILPRDAMLAPYML